MTSFERKKRDENIDKKYENSYNIDIMMMRKKLITLSHKIGKFGEIPKKPIVPWARTWDLLAVNWQLFHWQCRHRSPEGCKSYINIKNYKDLRASETVMTKM